jgi:hypothetical protein
VEQKVADVRESIGTKDDLEIIIESELMRALGNFMAGMMSHSDERLAGGRG